MKKMKWIAPLLALSLAMGMLAGCGSNTVYQNRSETFAASYDNAVGMALNAEAAAAPNEAKARGTESGISLPENRKWIITMSLSTETEDLDATLEALDGQISAVNGYVESQNINNSSAYSRVRSASLSIRIPSEQLDAFVAEVGGIANIVSNSRNVQDITLAYSDTEGRVTALKAEQERLLELMSQAESMSDLLEIEGRLTEVRYQLENYASTLRLYDNQVDYATVSLYINEVKKFTPAEEPSFWERITDGLADSIVNLGQSSVDLVAWIIVASPYLVVWGIVLWGGFVIVRRAVRRRRAKKEAKKAKV